MNRRLLPVPFLLLVGLGTAASAEAPDWNTVATVETVDVLTTDDEGEAAEITVWLVVVDGQGYLRTGDTGWRPYVERNPEIGLRVEESVHELRVVPIEDPALRATVVAAFREKYGFSDWMIGLFRGGNPLLMRLDPR